MTMEQVHNIQLASDLGRMNLAVNGGLEIWQRGTSFSTSSAFGADRWQFNCGGSSTITWTRVSTNTVDSTRSGYCAGFTYTHNAASDFIQQLAGDMAFAIGKQLSLSIRVWCNTANCARAFVWDSINGYRFSS